MLASSESDLPDNGSLARGWWLLNQSTACHGSENLLQDFLLGESSQSCPIAALLLETELVLRQIFFLWMTHLT